MRLYIGKNHESGSAPVQSIFRLIGNDEDALTFALGFLLAHDSDLCVKLVQRFGVSVSKEFQTEYAVYLQEVTGHGFGRRDIVIEASQMRVVLEAKIGNAEPSAEQLLKYASEDGLWQQYTTKVIVALTQVPLMKSTEERARSMLAKQYVEFRSFHWHQVLAMLLRHKSSGTGQWLLDQLVYYMRRDYQMGYHDAEIMIQDTNLRNAKIYENCWVYVASPRSKKAPLYFAPYYTDREMEVGLRMISRVLYVENGKLDELTIPQWHSAEHQQRWREGLTELRKRAEEEGFLTNDSRLLFLDKPIVFRNTALTKRAFNEKGPSKQIPNQIPQSFSLQFDELLRAP